MPAELTMLSYGAGQDSFAIACKLMYDVVFRESYAPRSLIAVTSDTGNEHPETYGHLKVAMRMFKKKNIPFYFLVPEMGFHTDSWTNLKQYYRDHSAIGSKAFPKTCTDNLKIKPIYRFLENYVCGTYKLEGGRKKGFYEFKERFGKLVVLIGIAAGEEKRVSDGSSDPVWMRECIEKRYPLLELGMNRKDCQQYVRSIGHLVPPPSNCMLCPYMSEVELLWLHYHYPQEYIEWVVMEAAKIEANQHMGEKNLGVFGKRLLPQVLEDAKKKYGHLSKHEINTYKFSHGHQNCQKY